MDIYNYYRSCHPITFVQNTFAHPLEDFGDRDRDIAAFKRIAAHSSLPRWRRRLALSKVIFLTGKEGLPRLLRLVNGLRPTRICDLGPKTLFMDKASHKVYSSLFVSLGKNKRGDSIATLDLNRVTAKSEIEHILCGHDELAHAGGLLIRKISVLYNSGRELYFHPVWIHESGYRIES